MSSQQTQLPTIVFTPGAWHEPWVFDPVREDLAGRGYPTAAAALASVGCTDPDVGLDQDAEAVRAVLRGLIDAGRDVVVVAHSYGGVPVSNAVRGLHYKDRAAQGLSGGVIMVVYMASFVIAAGESLLDGKERMSLETIVTDGFALPCNPIPRFFADLELSLATRAVEGLVRQTLKSFQGVSGFEPWNEGFEMGYIFAEDDQVISLDKQIEMSSQFPAGSFTASLPSHHSPFLSMPGALGKALQQAAEVAVAKRAN
ncbi:hypothetical protein CTA2_1279 [Colletotrichum tanaceti]|uniref:AB hydrolase-1 domain-containing protein n=1 Tax=Colletotrichum tanaceti TaxID=1306861 RepID=A0A4U6X5P9_9PEZI|nr:hypothetical protein CTA2_1274 [Colletotrichum tanaceti]KAJ0167668.1 hypothetical protein CTA2_1279 [Colletotrichum tanaceti]TKW50303.1 hypothetical protein CTA1_7026 [Colletotrichum tanaceti]